jgi:hypothetical protein
MTSSSLRCSVRRMSAEAERRAEQEAEMRRRQEALW